MHPAAVVGDLYGLLPASFDLKFDSGCAGIKRVLKQLLHHRRRPLDHFSGCNLVGNVFRKYVDAPHGSEASFAEGEQGSKGS